MVLLSNSYSGSAYQQQGNPQTGNPYGMSMGAGYNSTSLSHQQYQNMPTGGGYGHGHSHGHGYGHGHNYQHQNQHGMTAYSGGSMGFAGNPCPPTGNGYGSSYTGGPGMYGNMYSGYKEADD